MKKIKSILKYILLIVLTIFLGLLTFISLIFIPFFIPIFLNYTKELYLNYLYKKPEWIPELEKIYPANAIEIPYRRWYSSLRTKKENDILFLIKFDSENDYLIFLKKLQKNSLSNTIKIEGSPTSSRSIAFEYIPGWGKESINPDDPAHNPNYTICHGSAILKFEKDPSLLIEVHILRTSNKKYLSILVDIIPNTP